MKGGRNADLCRVSPPLLHPGGPQRPRPWFAVIGELEPRAELVLPL